MVAEDIHGLVALKQRGPFYASFATTPQSPSRCILGQFRDGPDEKFNWCLAALKKFRGSVPKCHRNATHALSPKCPQIFMLRPLSRKRE